MLFKLGDVLDGVFPFFLELSPVGDSHLFKERLVVGAVPVELNYLEGVCSTCECGEHYVRHNSYGVVHSVSLSNPLVLFKGGGASGVVGDYYVSLNFFSYNLQLSLYSERPGELSFGEDVSESESTAVIPGGVVNNLSSELLYNCGRSCGSLSVVNLRVVGIIVSYHLPGVASVVYSNPYVGNVNSFGLSFPFIEVCNFVPHCVNPFGVVNDFLGYYDSSVFGESSELLEDGLNSFSELFVED